MHTNKVSIVEKSDRMRVNNSWLCEEDREGMLSGYLNHVKLLTLGLATRVLDFYFLLEVELVLVLFYSV